MKKFLLLIALSAPQFLQAQSGTLDKSFGDTGIVFSNNVTGYLYKIALQSTGKIIGAGSGGLNNTTAFRLIRYNTDGSIDESFGNNGVTGGTEIGQALGIAIVKGNGIVVFDGYLGKVKLAKYKKDGGLDSSFGKGGIVITQPGKSNATSGIAIQPDEKIVICGYIINEANEARQGFLLRYLPDGSLDASFGDNGIVIWGTPDGDKSLSTVNALALQQNGQIVLSLTLNSGSAVYRFNMNGSQDEDFGNKGTAFFQTTDESVHGLNVNNLAVQPDGKIIGGGNALLKKNPNDKYMAAARLNADGSIDSSFGNNGIQHVLFGKDDSQGTAILLQKDGKIILSGFANAPDYTYGYFALARFDNNGIVDSSFGENGNTTTSIGSFATSFDAALQEDEKIVQGGTSGLNFAFARYNNDSQSKKQIIITKIKRWLQHRNGIVWDNANGIKNYTVQRSGDGVNWLTVSGERLTVNSQLTSAHYYNDPAPLSGSNYYRLQTNSVDGAVNYSNIIAVTANEAAVKISPNPAKNNLHIEGVSSNKTKLTVVDFTGNIKLQAVANNTSYNLNIASLAIGNYLLKIEMNGEVATKKFLKE